MKKRYWLIKRRAIYYLIDSESNRKESLGTRDRQEAESLLKAKLDGVNQPQMNLAMAKAYLSSQDEKMTHRTWADVIDRFCQTGKASTQERAGRAFASKDFAVIRKRKLIGTTGEDFLTVLDRGGAATNHYLRRLHNLALGMCWLTGPVLAPKVWPKTPPKPRRAITLEEHQAITESTKSLEWRLFYELLWETGAAQSDAANLTDRNVDIEDGVLVYERKKLAGRESAVPACIQIGTRLSKFLSQLPSTGALFPKILPMSANHRASEFRRKCRVLGISGVSLHSYRYAWAERAKKAGYPERWAQAALGHNSKAVHRAYAKGAEVVCPSLEEYERKLIKFPVSSDKSRAESRGEGI